MDALLGLAFLVGLIIVIAALCRNPLGPGCSCRRVGRYYERVHSPECYEHNPVRPVRARRPRTWLE